MTQTKTWAEMSTAERTVFLAPLINKQIRVVVQRDLEAGHRAFGVDFPLPWKETRLLSLEPRGGKPALMITAFFDSMNPLSGMWNPFGRIMLLFEDIAAIEAIPAPAPEPPTPQITCPHCGKPLLLTAQAAEE